MKRLILIFAVLSVAGAVCAENISVVTVDVWSGLTYSGIFRVREYENSAAREFRYDLLSAGLADIAPDIIAIQDANPLPAYVERLSGDLGYESVSAVRQAGVRIGPVGLPTNLREGSALLAIRERALTHLSTGQLTGAGAGNVAAFQFGAASNIVAARLQVADRPVYVFTTRWTPSPHADRDRMRTLIDRYDSGDLSGPDLLDLMQEAVDGGARRLDEAERTLVFINEIAGQSPVILMGSFHALPESDEMQLLREAGFVDVWQVVGRGAGATYDPAANTNIRSFELSPSDEPERIDYIFIRGDDIAARNVRLIFNRPTYGVFPSDHYGVYAELRIDPAE
jgi:endonuclease/exonuclease/phosphatase family metal-dependent hydrolase